jgi:2-dehydropantoate 2-reductase
MKILVLGAGAIGGYYGARLIEAGADVTFQVRPTRKNLLETNRLNIVSGSGNFSQKVRAVTADELQDLYDIVLLTCKTYDLDQAADAIAPIVKAGAHVLPFLNGVDAYARLDAKFGKEKVLGGVAYIATMQEADGTIQHLGTNDSVLIGPRDPSAEGVAREFYNILASTEGTRVLSANIDQALWDKWVMITAGAAMCCLMRGTIKEIMATEHGTALMNQTINECAEVARRSDRELTSEKLTDIRSRLLDRTSSWAASMMRDIAQGQSRLEADGIVGDMVKRANSLGVSAPITTAAYSHLQIYMARTSG